MHCEKTSNTEPQSETVGCSQTGDVAAQHGIRERSLGQRTWVMLTVGVLQRRWSFIVDRPKRIAPVEAGAHAPKPRRGGPPILAIRARYGDGELVVEARERWAIAALVVLAAIAALAAIASLVV